MKLPEFNKIKTNVDFEKLLTLFVLVDICLLPYIRPLRCTMSMLLLIAWYGFRVVNNKLNIKAIGRYLWEDKEALAFAVTCVLIAISALAGIITLPSRVPAGFQDGDIGVLSRTITYSAIYVYAFLYYFFFREMVKKYPQMIYSIIKILFVSFFVFALIYLISPALFYRIRTFWTLSGKTQNITTAASSHFRYTYSFSDPNNFAAIAVSVMILIVENKRESKNVKIGAVISCVLMLIAAMSVQGIIGFCCYVGVKAIGFAIKIYKKEVKVDKKYIRIGLGILVVGVLAIPIALQFEIVKMAIARVFNNGGSFAIRWNIWKNLLQGKGVVDYLLFGRGCAIVLNGTAVSSHNGHLYLLYAYGFIAYLMFMYVFFRKRRYTPWRRLLFLLPLFVCFSINVGLLEARYSFYMAAITAFGLRKYKIRKSQQLPNSETDRG